MKADALITQLAPRSGMAPTQVAAGAACGRRKQARGTLVASHGVGGIA